MESGTTHEAKPAASETENVLNTDSVESFQSFIYELFEKNGILNDLRAYLRGHIVDVLKRAQTGDPPACQKKFMQRLDLTYQALNMLVAEYLMRLEFSYSFSVFVSEIPLANMVFGFAKSLMAGVNNNSSEIRFKEADVWSILNYLGVQCDSEHASNIIQMYNNEPQNPLLLCILKCMPMYKECDSQKSLSGVSADSSKYCDSTELEAAYRKEFEDSRNSAMPECSHSACCKKCQRKMYKLKERYKKKKKYLAKFANKYKPRASESFTKSEILLKNINIVEKNLIEEMFQQIKSVYESEVEMVKVEEKKKVEKSMATQAIQLQRKRNELEEAFKAREQELERSVQHKKKFLWGLARSLRDQHLHMTRAMHNVRAETERLELKEDSLKTQLAEAEQILKKRGEEMRVQISNELAVLETHLASMKREREIITRECSELENLKTIQDSPSKVTTVHNLETEEIHSHYDLLKSELEILKTYIKSSQIQAKCVIERATMTEATEPVSQTNVALNNRQGNGQGCKSDDFDERVKMNQLVNDFKKKNVNFTQSNLDEIYDRSRDRSHSSNSSEGGDTAAPDVEPERGRDRDRDVIRRLREENDRLKAFARQRCSAATRPRTAPADLQRMLNLNNGISASTLNVGWRKGAGEELSMFSNAQPRILVPGDTLPFIGILRDRHGNNRRPLAAGRTRALSGVSKRTAPPVRERHAPGASSSGQGRVSGSQLAEASCSLQPDEDTYPLMRDRLQQRPRAAVGIESRNVNRSNKSLLKEAKETLPRRDSNMAPCSSTVSSRDRSPDSVLREAKLRLRKLEIEAEAVEQSYRDFRRRQSERRAGQEPNDGLAKALDVTRSHSTHELEATRNDIETHFAILQKTVRADFDKYMLDYKTKFDVGETYFRNKTTVSEEVKPIPDTLEVDCAEREVRSYYLEAPLTEFRKLYTSAKQSRPVDTETRTHSAIISVSNTEFEHEISARNDALQKIKHSKQAELQILRRNINQMYHGSNRDSALDVDQQINQASAEDENNLRVEVESISEINDIKSQTQDLLLVVQSTVNSEVASEVFSAQMTIIVSPKRASSPSDRKLRSPSPEQAARLTRNDVLDAIFHADPNDVSSVQMQLALSKEEVSMSEYDKGDYPVDFAGAGNYSRSESDRSRISLPVMDGGDRAEDDNFWQA